MFPELGIMICPYYCQHLFQWELLVIWKVAEFNFQEKKQKKITLLQSKRSRGKDFTEKVRKDKAKYNEMINFRKTKLVQEGPENGPR